MCRHNLLTTSEHASDAVCALQAAAHEDGSEQSADQRQAAQLGEANSALEAGDEGMDEADLAAVAANEVAVLDQLLGELGISEGDQPQSPLHGSQSAASPQQLDDAVTLPHIAAPAHTQQQHRPQVAASAAAPHTEPPASRDAVFEGAAT